MVKVFLETLATLLQVPQKTFWRLQKFCKRPKGENGACRTSAKTKKEKSELAELLQTPKRRKWSLQDSCKCPKGKNGACRTSAKTKKEKSELAELLQTPKREKWSLQRRCKCFEKLSGVCRNAASTSKNVLAPRVTSVEALCLHRTHVNRKRDPPWGTFVCLIVSWSPKRIAEWASTDN